jgi:hypothetical protein
MEAMVRKLAVMNHLGIMRRSREIQVMGRSCRRSDESLVEMKKDSYCGTRIVEKNSHGTYMFEKGRTK